MRGFTFSLSSFLAGTTLLAIYFGAIAADTRFMTSLAYTFLLGLLCYGLAQSCIRWRRKDYWIGFTTFGLFYWLVLFPTIDANPYSYNYMVWGGGYSRPKDPLFVTNDLIDLLERRLTPNVKIGAHVSCRWNGGGYFWGTVLQHGTDGRIQIQWDDGSPATWQAPADISTFSSNRRIALHCTVATLWAWLGGALLVTHFGPRSSEKRAATNAEARNETTSTQDA